MSEDPALKFLITQSHPCSYLPEQEATTVILDPSTAADQKLQSYLSRHGFRRAGQHLHKPRCQRCSQCISSRVSCAEFSPNRSQRRVMARNSDLELHCLSDISEPRFYHLYERYINSRHADGDMYPASPEQYEDFLLNHLGNTRFWTFFLEGEPVCVAVTDQLDDGLSAVYTFFDPDMPERSLGRNAILQQIQIAKDLGLPHLYLGYWIRDCEKMRYKTEYRPLQLLLNGRWVMLR